MNAFDCGLVTDLPHAVEWDFGGYPYGLEPLALPLDPLRTEPSMVGWTGPADEDLHSRCRDLLADTEAGRADGLPPPDPVEQLFWFRWITGHQTVFILWQLLANAVADAADLSRREASLRRAGRFVRGYSAMLLYTSSCPREIYHRVIRPSMALQHPAFSGAWARDYGPVRALLRGQAPAAWGQDAAVVLAECELTMRIHEGVAQKLVPGAPSLLQESLGQGHVWRRGVLALLYDTYFLTLRVPLPARAVQTQLVRRLRAIQRDLAANGLHPGYASGEPEKPPLLLAVDVAACERGLPTLLFDIAGDAIDQPVAGSSNWTVPGR